MAWLIPEIYSHELWKEPNSRDSCQLGYPSGDDTTQQGASRDNSTISDDPRFVHYEPPLATKVPHPQRRLGRHQYLLVDLVCALDGFDYIVTMSIIL